MSERFYLYKFLQDTSVALMECGGAIVRWTAGQLLFSPTELTEDEDLRCIAAGSEAAMRAVARLY